MVQARVINDTTTVEVTSEQQETVVGVTSQDTVGRVRAYSSGNHSNLTGRDLPDQHPISAITGLQEALIAVSDKTYIHEQSEASDIWYIQHNLGKYPSVEIVDTAGNRFFPAVQWIDENNCVATMNGACKGKAFLN